VGEPASVGMPRVEHTIEGPLVQRHLSGPHTRRPGDLLKPAVRRSPGEFPLNGSGRSRRARAVGQPRPRSRGRGTGRPRAVVGSPTSATKSPHSRDGSRGPYGSSSGRLMELASPDGGYPGWRDTLRRSRVGSGGRAGRPGREGPIRPRVTGWQKRSSPSPGGRPSRARNGCRGAHGRDRQGGWCRRGGRRR
jgi:hypothetical protein